MKVFITGISGLLGSTMARYLIMQGDKVVGIDNMIGGVEGNVPDHQDCEYHRGDILDTELMKEIMTGCDVVFHTASLPYEGLSVFSPTVTATSIVSGTISTAIAALHNNVRLFINCSSMARYGNQETPFTEEMDTKPEDPYGIAKVAVEQTIKLLCDVHGMEYNIAVPHNIVGPNQKYDDPFRNVASIMINMILQNKQPIIYGDGNQERCFSDIRDCIYCLDQLCMNKHINEEIFNIGPDEETISINDLYDMISNKLKFNLPPIYVKDRPNEVKHAMCSSQRARERINYVTKYTLEDSIDDLISYIKENGSKKFKNALKLVYNIGWCLSGTPIFNGSRDFESLCRLAKLPLTVSKDELSRKYMIRRTKEELCQQTERLRLPPLNFQLHELEMTSDELFVYQQVWDKCMDIANQAIESEMKQYFHMLLLECLLRVRQCCIHPQLYFDGIERQKHKNKKNKKWTRKEELWSGSNAKLEKIREILNTEEEQKTIVFTQFTVEQELLQTFLEEEGWEVYKLSGLEDRDQKSEALRLFKETPNPRTCILIQIKAGGVGLNVQQATRIIFTAPSWNPATELQAIGRSHRTGQAHKVTVHKLAYLDPSPALSSVDQCMMNLQHAKQLITAEILGDDRLLEKIPIPTSKQSLKDLISIFLKGNKSNTSNK